MCPRDQIPFAPGGDDLNIRFQRVAGQLKAHLIIAFTGRPMGHGIGAGLFGDLN